MASYRNLQRNQEQKKHEDLSHPSPLSVHHFPRKERSWCSAEEYNSWPHKRNAHGVQQKNTTVEHIKEEIALVPLVQRNPDGVNPPTVRDNPSNGCFKCIGLPNDMECSC
ncbi:hypothetical protein HPP92_019635 [Vanilla planifolia]|uniref:Uncharacterized protein n=1 Tax=Vanilla planifolia TaxID=51239 RepID=A0A835Q386_VANPL|nr:hypothetical protein HPP92_019635 [Vanilla planifolia]